MSAATERSMPLAAKAARKAVRGFSKLPAPVISRLARSAPTNTDGERMAPEVAVILAAMNKMPAADFVDLSLEEGREGMEVDAIVFGESFGPFAVEEDLFIPGPVQPIPATRLRHRAEHPRGLVVFFHGGGWVLGSRVSHDSAARFLAVEAGVDVLVVDYRLAPENPFPAAIDDALAAWQFAVKHAESWGFDPQQLVIAGDSAGGNIAAVLAQMLRDHDVAPALQVLIYPVTDLSTKHPSQSEFAEGFFLTDRQMDWYEHHYIQDDADRLDPMASPLLAEDVTGVAPAYVAVAGFDPLRDEGLAYAKKLQRAGVRTTIAREGELIHAFINMTSVSPTARDATKRIARAIRDALTVPLRGLKD